MNATELVVVLVDPPRSAVLDKETRLPSPSGRATSITASGRTRRARVAELLRGPVVADPQHSLPRSCLGRRLDVRLSLPREEGGSRGAAVGEHPCIELQVVQHVTVVVDRATQEPLPRPDDAGAPQQPVAL